MEVLLSRLEIGMIHGSAAASDFSLNLLATTSTTIENDVVQ